LRIVKKILGIILILFGSFLFVGGILDQKARIATVIGFMFIVPGILLVKKKKKKTESTQKQSVEITRPHKDIIYPDTIAKMPSMKKGKDMATCKRCGKGGFFHKVNEHRLCVDCARVEALEAEADSLKNDIARYKAAYQKEENEYNEIKEKKEIFYNQIAQKAKEDALTQIATDIDDKNSELQDVINKITKSTDELTKMVEEQNKSHKTLNANANKLLKVQTLFKSLQYAVNRYFDEESVPKSILDESFDEADELLSTTVKLKLNLMDVRELRKRYAQNNKIIQELLIKYQGRYTTKTNIAIYRLMVIALEAELQNILYNLKYSKLDKSIKDVKALTAKYQKITTDGNQNIAPTVAKFIGEVEYLFIEAIKIEYEYYVQKERIKEEQRAIREQMRIQAAERKQLEQERKKVEQEEEKYKQEIASVQSQLSNAKDFQLIKQLEERIAKIQSQLVDVEKKKDDIVKLEHGKAGSIYVISNLGSFGENIFKIGMTRRLSPQERIDELGDASVPFRFDVHTVIFSDNAPGLETKLHKHLHNYRVNKINLRKEFFKISIDELEELVYSLEPTAEFNRTMIAEQYHQSLGVKEMPESVEIIEDDSDVDYDEEDAG
jgi:DNA repair exonuclease SbcCD ATPase subunit